MGEMTIQRNRRFSIPQYQSVSKAEKQPDGVKLRKTSENDTVSENLRQLMGRVSQTENHIREGRRALMTGETVLDEVQDSLERMKELAQRAAGEGELDRDALQSELDRLREGIDRMLRGAAFGDTKLFLDDEAGLEESVDALLDAVLGVAAAKGDAALPDWLVRGLTLGTPSAERLLAELGLDKTASGGEILAAVISKSLEHDPAAGYLATLYLGAVIAGGDPSEAIDPREALEGIQQLLEKVAAGVPLDQAIEELTKGEFSGLADFQAQFTGGTAPGLQDFLVNLLLSDSEVLLTAEPPLLALLAGMESSNFDLLMGLLSSLQNSETGAETGLANPEAALMSEAAPGTEAAPQQAALEPGAELGVGEKPQASVLQFGNLQIIGRDLSGVSYRESTGELTVGGTADVLLQGTEQGTQAVRLTGSGTVALQNINGSTVAVDSPLARLFSAGRNTLAQITLEKGAGLIFTGGGLLKIGVLHADKSNTLRLTGGAVAVEEQENGESKAITASVLLEGAASLAARAAAVNNPNGQRPEAFDLVWKTLLPGWSGIFSMTVDGKQEKMSLLNPDPVRLWLDKGDPTHGFTIHTLIVRGRDELGRLRTRYAYLRWNQNAGRFQTVSMYPNPFTVTGGEEGQDWTYEEESHTLRILSAQVTAVAGGTGTDLNRMPFSGRIALEDSIGAVELSLGGVSCRVSSGNSFDLGRENDVTLVLQPETRSHFEGGAGCAGISLGDSSSLCIDCAKPHDDRTPIGALTAAGNGGGAGIGRDSGAGRDQTSRIFIRGGVITAVGAGGGAGIGAGKHGAIGSITITGGTISAEAGGHAAAIGAGVQGNCGDILISGPARIVKAVGGDPGADIGACLFGNCGEVRITGGADIGSAKVRRSAGVSLQLGEDAVTLPQFRLSSRTLRLDHLRVTTREYARSAKIAIDADRRRVAQIQGAYSALYGRLEESFSGLYSFRQYIDVPEEPVRDTEAANTLLQESILLQSEQAVRTHSQRGTEDVKQLLR